MSLVRIVVERLLALMFGSVGLICLVMGMAFMSALVGLFAMTGHSGAPRWANDTLIRGGAIGAILVAGSLMMRLVRARSSSPGAPARDGDESLPREWVWPASFPTLLLPAVAIVLSPKLFLLWSDILSTLRQLGARGDLGHMDSGAGLILLPILAVLFIPFLEAAAGLFLIVAPPLLLALLAARSHHFLMNCRRTLVAQVMFVGASWVGADLLGRLADLALPALRAAGEAEATVVIDALARGRTVLSGTALGYAAVVLAYGASLWVVTAARGSRPMASETGPSASSYAPLGEAAERDPVEMPAGMAPDLSTAYAPEPAAPRERFEDVLARVRAKQGRGSVPIQDQVQSTQASRPAIVRVAMLGLGALLLVLGAAQLIGPHARYVSSSPPAGASLAAQPEAIIVQFSQALDPSSTVTVQRTMAMDGTPLEQDAQLVRSAALDPGDRSGRTLRAESPSSLGGGVYRVDWRVTTMGQRDSGYGSFYFGVGIPVPEHVVGAAGKPYRERDAKARGHRAVVLSGVIFMILAALVPQRLVRG